MYDQRVYLYSVYEPKVIHAGLNILQMLNGVFRNYYINERLSYFVRNRAVMSDRTARNVHHVRV